MEGRGGEEKVGREGNTEDCLVDTCPSLRAHIKWHAVTLQSLEMECEPPFPKAQG